MAYRIDQTKVRESLAARIQEPYWGVPLARGRSLGFRKIAAERASWIARMRPEAGSAKYEYKALGAVTREFDYEAAKLAALEWFESRDGGVDGDDTVAEACREYVKELRRKNGEASAHDADKRFERTVYEDAIGGIRLDKLRTPRLKDWRDRLRLSKGERAGLSKGSANRTMTALKAALNLAVTNGRVDLRAAQAWRNVKPFKNASARRTLFLDLKQRRKLLEVAGSGALGDLMQAAALTGARAGELVNATRGQFDARLKTIQFKGKTGPRTIPLSVPAIALFTRLAKSKLPAAPLLTRDDGKPWAHSDWDELVRDAAKAAKLPKGTCLYTLRHSFITQAITDGMTTLDVARLCGTSVGMIEKHYGHLVADAARERLASVKML
jgi:integrase